MLLCEVAQPRRRVSRHDRVRSFAAHDRRWVVRDQLNRQIAASVPKNTLSHCVAMSEGYNDSRALRGYDDNGRPSPAGSGR